MNIADDQEDEDLNQFTKLRRQNTENQSEQYNSKSDKSNRVYLKNKNICKNVCKNKIIYCLSSKQILNIFKDQPKQKERPFHQNAHLKAIAIDKKPTNGMIHGKDREKNLKILANTVLAWKTL